jgi:hypothetical protein
MKAKCPTATRPVALIVGLLVAGCAKQDTSCPVKGRVTVNGRAAAGLYVAFHPADARGRPVPAAARTGGDGTFNLRVPGPGEYAVTAFWPRITMTDGESVEGEDGFRGAFRDTQRPATKATIVTGENDLVPIALKFDFRRP